MPVNFSVKGVPDALAAGLRARAARNHRSLQRELMAIVEVAVATPEAFRRRIVNSEPGGEAAGAADRTAEPLRSIEEIAEELRKLFPRTRNRGPSSVEIIRHMRDGRYGETWGSTGQHGRLG